MTTSNNTFAATTIVGFHIGRGGRFHNSGHKQFIGECKITDFVNDLFVNYENMYEISKKIGNRENLRELLQDVLDEKTDAKARFERRTGLEFGEEVYTDGGGNQVGLTVEEAYSTGIGKINIDNDYNTTYTCRLEDCDESELQLILYYEGYVNSEIRAYAEEYLNS